jgi:hypothetical protein
MKGISQTLWFIILLIVLFFILVLFVIFAKEIIVGTILGGVG